MNKDWIATICVGGTIILGVAAMIEQGNRGIDTNRSLSSAMTATGQNTMPLDGTHSDATPHAPNMQSFGSYHVEATASPSGNVELHFYGGKASELMPIDTMIADVMDAKIIVPGEDVVPLTLHAKPYSGEPKFQSSRFVAHFDRRPEWNQVGLALELPYEGKTYRINWTPQTLVLGANGSHSDAVMPVAVGDAAARQLFLTPGGIYTAADIQANGNTTPGVKFAGLMAKHNMSPAVGSPICPVTDTAADKRFSWIIGGKTYLFCCPPCVEEFVKKAKEEPDTILPPERYIRTNSTAK